MNIPFPTGGVSEDFSLTDQPPLTAVTGQNCRATGAKTGRFGNGGPRSGTTRYPDTPLSAGLKVQHLATVTYDLPNQTYSSLGGALTTDWSAANPVAGDTLGVQVGSQSDVYVIDGPTGVAKFNADGTKLWKLALAADDKSHVVRALLIDASTPGNNGTDLVLAGVSTGGSSLTAKAWAYIQLDDNKTEKLWEMNPGGFTEASRIYHDKLYLLVNFPDRNRAAIIVYDGYLTPNPTEVNRWGVPYPAHDMDVSLKDGFIFTASDANAARDANRKSPKASLESEDWTPYDLTSYQERVWSWHDATRLDTISIVPRNLAVPGSAVTVSSATPPDELDGGNVLMWVDKSGNGRNWYQAALPVLGAGSAASRGAIFRRNGIGGKPSLHFDGVTTGMQSEVPGSIDKAARSEQLSTLPSYTGAQFVCCMVVRIAADSTPRGVLGWGLGANWESTGRFIIANSFISNSTTPSGTDGQVYCHEPSGVASDASSSTPACTAPLGASGFPLGFGLPDSGLAVLTWICDGGLHDVFGTATRSSFRVNGHPCDRWQSIKFASIVASTLGFIAGPTTTIKGMVGEIGEMIVLSDWYDSNDTLQRLMTMPAGYPDANPVSLADSEIERLEGYLAHKWGLAHELSGGNVGILRFISQPNNLDTVSIAANTYTFKTTPTTAFDIARGADVGESARNFYSALAFQGSPGTDYIGNTQNADVRPTRMSERQTGSASDQVYVRPRNPFGAAAGYTLSESTSGVRMAWQAATVSATVNGSGHNNGWYPHPFYIERTTNTAGGPPSVAGTNWSVPSNYWKLRSVYPIIAAWDPANGRCKDVLTSNFDGSGTGVGGVGYGVRVASTGEVFSCGPRQATVSTLPAIVADAVDVRKFTWSNSAFGSLTPGASNDVWAWGSGSTPASPGALGYAYPRMAVDKFDNLYVPYFGTGNDSLIGFTRASLGSGPGYNPVVLFEYSSLADHNEAHAVAVDPLYPAFQVSNALNRAEFLLLATRIESAPTTRSTVFKLKALSSTQTAGSARNVVAIGVSDGAVYTFTSAAKTLISGSDPLDSAAGFIDSFEMFGKRVYTDGKNYRIFDPTQTTAALRWKKYTSTGPGVIPPRCRIAATWRQRPVLARPIDNPNQIFFGKQGEIANFDMKPYTITSIMAIVASDAAAGMPADIINAFIPIADDLAYIGGDHTILRLTGDPSVGTIHLVSSSIGIAYGRAWCKDPRGNLYFFGSRGGVYILPPVGDPVPLSSSENPHRNKIERRLQAIDLSAYFIRMEWNDVDKGFHIIVCPYGAGGTIVEHYFWEETGGWWPDKWLTAGIQPTAICVMDGDLAADRVVLFGCNDGYVRKWDRNSTGDDTVPSTGLASKYIDSLVRIGPLAGANVDREYLFERLWCVFANGEGAPWVKVYATDRPDVLGDPIYQAKMQPGRNPWWNIKVRGSYVYIDLQLSDPRQRWSFESMGFAEVKECGIARMA